MKPAMAFMPNTRIGMVHLPRQLLTSVAQYSSERKRRQKPPLNRTKELVHMCLLIGNQPFQSSPPSTPRIPKKLIPPMSRAAIRFDLSQCPVKTPMTVVAIAGIV
jgi:hypothetical protein